MIVKTPLDFGCLVKDRRKALGLTQDQLASRLGVSRLWVVEFEKGKANAQLGLALRALNDLNVLLDADISGASRVQPGDVDLDCIIREATGPSRR